jgi:hypothetical protein
MQTMNSGIVTDAAIIREMDAEELLDKARELYSQPNTIHSHSAYVLCKEQYRQITGHDMQTKLFLLESI